MPYILNKYYPVRNIIFFLGEGLLIFLTINVVYLAFTGWQLFLDQLFLDALRALVVTIIFQLSLYFFDLYDLSWVTTPLDTFIRMVQAFGVGCVVLAGIYYTYPPMVISTAVFWTSYWVICGILLGWRLLYYMILKKRLFSRPIIMIGTGKIASEIAREIEGRADSGYKIASFIGNSLPHYNPNQISVLPQASHLLPLCYAHEAKRIIVALDDRRGTMPIEQLLECKLQGIVIEEGITFYESITGKILVENVNPAWLIFSEGFQKSRIRYLVKRVLDIVLSVVGLTVSLPVTIPIAILIKLESPGPVFYLQERVGEKGRVFNVIKFRSMRQDAEKDGAVWARQNDSRVTRVGGFIRKVRIDEIPQMWNVLKGEMSFVGPRPERPMFVERLTESIPYYSLRHSVKPGITGWAQVCYPYGASEEDALRKLEYDLYYIKNLSIFIDLLVIFRTIKTVLFQKGSR